MYTGSNPYDIMDFDRYFVHDLGSALNEIHISPNQFNRLDTEDYGDSKHVK